MKLEEGWNEGRLFHRWCRENDQHVRKFKFYKRISKEIHENVEVPDWNKADLSLLCKFLPIMLTVNHRRIELGAYLLTYLPLPSTPLSGHVAKKVVDPKDLTTLDKLVKTRNKIAHGTRQEISEEAFDKEFQQLKDIAMKLFKSFADLVQAWEHKFEDYKSESQDLQNLEELAGRYEKWRDEVLQVRFSCINWEDATRLMSQ